MPDCFKAFHTISNWDNRFLDLWGEEGNGPEYVVGRCVVIATLSSSSAQPVMVCDGADVEVLEEWDSPSPANFGGDGHTYWGLYVLTPTAPTFDLNGTTGAFRHLTIFETFEDAGSFGHTYVRDLQYSGSQFGVATEFAIANNSVRTGDACWYWIDNVERSIDTHFFEKFFSYDADPSYFNHDATEGPGEFIPLDPGGGAQSAIDWLQYAQGNSGITAGFRGTATADTFPGSCRILCQCITVTVRARCEMPVDG